MVDTQGVTAIIVAAGRGSRMGPRTASVPKCLLEFAGSPLLEWQLAALRKVGIEDVRIVGGYEHQQLDRFGLTKYLNPEWDSSNMVYSLMCAREAFLSGNTVVVAYADIIYETRVLETLLSHPQDAVTVIDENWLALWSTRFEDPLDDAETLQLADSNRITEIGQKATDINQIQAQYIGLTKFTARGATAFADLHARIAELIPGKEPRNCYFTDVLQAIASSDIGLFGAPTHSGWLEFDSGEDIAGYMQLAGQGKLNSLWDEGAI